MCRIESNKYEMKLQLNFMRFIIAGNTFSEKKNCIKINKGRPLNVDTPFFLSDKVFLNFLNPM